MNNSEAKFEVETRASVIKSDGRTEDFSLQKLMTSVYAAGRAAGESDGVAETNSKKVTDQIWRMAELKGEMSTFEIRQEVEAILGPLSLESVYLYNAFDRII